MDNRWPRKLYASFASLRIVLYVIEIRICTGNGGHWFTSASQDWDIPAGGGDSPTTRWQQAQDL